MFRITAKDFREFKKECQRWIEYFGFKDWRVVYYHKSLNDTSVNAQWVHSIRGKIISITLNTYIEEWHSMAIIAFHEVVEGMLLAPLTQHIDTKYIEDDVIGRDRHTIVRILENTLFRDVKP